MGLGKGEEGPCPPQPSAPLKTYIHMYIFIWHHKGPACAHTWSCDTGSSPRLRSPEKDEPRGGALGLHRSRGRREDFPLTAAWRLIGQELARPGRPGGRGLPARHLVSGSRAGPRRAQGPARPPSPEQNRTGPRGPAAAEKHGSTERKGSSMQAPRVPREEGRSKALTQGPGSPCPLWARCPFRPATPRARRRQEAPGWRGMPTPRAQRRHGGARLAGAPSPGHGGGRRRHQARAAPEAESEGGGGAVLPGAALAAGPRLPEH
uniref:Uncharacterized protein n=1 Tax=Pipistrellus kuhlii TaxID=59472 RepID=A0A7J7QWP6_PIPKU|nr:hypothetical protein mPipKuh1_008236 [Pipistrellus kuhlii]